MTAKVTYHVVFPAWYDERGEWEAESKGWLQGAELHSSHGEVYPLFFYDPVRLGQDLEREAQHGKPYIAHPGLIVIPTITREAILQAVTKLLEADFFPMSISAEHVR